MTVPINRPVARRNLRRRPVRVTMTREPEIVVRGFVSMMNNYADRLQVVAVPPRNPLARSVDITLTDLRLVATPGCVMPPEGKLVAWTWGATHDVVEMALRNGASGVLSRNLSGGAVVAALEAIHRGRVVVKCDTPTPAAHHQTDSSNLTARERDIVTLVTNGLDNMSIARQAGISINSVKSYIRSAYAKMGVSSRSQAVLWGVRHGLLDPADPAGALALLPVDPAAVKEEAPAARLA